MFVNCTTHISKSSKFNNMRFKVFPQMREKIRVVGDIPTLNVLEMIENEFQGKFNGKLEIDQIEEVVGHY